MLHAVQNELNTDPRNANLLASQRCLSHSLWRAIFQEKSFLKQKSRVQWLKERDKNSARFHNQVKNRWNTNKILSIEDDTGTLVHGQENVQRVAVNYYSNLLGSKLSTPYKGLNDLRHIFTKTISQLRPACLTRRFRRRNQNSSV